VSDQPPPPIGIVTTARIAAKRRRWKRWVALFLFLSLAGGLYGLGYWAIDTNQLGKFISKKFAERLPAHLHIGKTEFDGLEALILSDLQLMDKPGGTAAVTVDRVIVYGALWKGQIANVRVENLRLYSTAESVQFLHHVIQIELARKSDGPPSFLHLDFTGGVYVNGEIAIADAEVGVDTTGPIITVDGKAKYVGNNIALTITTETTGNKWKYHITLNEGVLPIWRSCDWLADLNLLPRLPPPARVWVPEFADARGTVISADQNWRIFDGLGKARWTSGEAQGKIYVDDQRVDIKNATMRDQDIGHFFGDVLVETNKNITHVRARDWHPGPRVPIPAFIPTAQILETFPAADVTATGVSDGWQLSCRLFHPDNNAQAILRWGPTWPLMIEGQRIALPLLQAFSPPDLALAAGQAKMLNATVNEHGLDNFSATIDGGRFLWGDWALGSFHGDVALRMTKNGGAALSVSAPGMGELTYDYIAESQPPQGKIALNLSQVEALAVRLKGPVALPDISGAIKARAVLQKDNDVMRLAIEQLNVNDVGITDIMRRVTTSASGLLSFYPNRIAAHMVGQLSSGEVRLPGTWHDLSRRQPKYNAQLSFGNEILLLENLLVRATDATGAEKIDGFSAGLRGRFSAKEQSGTVIGTVDHADLVWLNTLMPIDSGVAHGECAVTFTTEIDKKGVRSIAGNFLPLNASVKLPGILQAQGIKGAVQFRIEQKTPPANEPAAP
jgi:hypothetical protein